MRSVDSWKRGFIDDLKALEGIYGPLKMPASRLLDVELILTLLHDHFPGEDPTLGWAAFNGQPFPALQKLPEEGQRAVALARLRLPILGRGAWQRDREDYCQKVPAPYKLYRLAGPTLLEEPTSVLPERKAAMRQALCTPPPLKEQPEKYADAGRYRFFIRQDRHEVEIPGWAVQIKDTPLPGYTRANSAQRAPLHIPLSALQEEARWMDQHALKGSAADQPWEQRLQAIQLRLVRSNGLEPGDALTLDGLVHMIGMVGSGKSSLFTVLAVYLARRGYRVVMVQSDVTALLREHAVFEALRQADPLAPRSVPLIGRFTRTVHLNRLHIAESLRSGAAVGQDHAAYPMLSTVCPLDGLRQEVHPIIPGEERCTALYSVANDEETPANRYTCPFMPRCPVHLPARNLAAAPIWLATPASLLASGPQHPIERRNVRYAELVMRHADVVLVDEADLVQVQFDTRFAPTEVLVGSEDSWLDHLAVQVARQIHRPGRPLVGRTPALDRWLLAHENTQRAVNRLYRWLRESAATRQWLGQTYFSGERLLQKVAGELVSYPFSKQAFEAAVTTFLDNPLERGIPAGRTPLEWHNAVHLELLSGDEEAALQELHTWLLPQLPGASEQEVDALAHHLLLALIVVVLDRALHELIREWPAASEKLELDRGGGGLFYSPADDLIRLAPEPPMGAVLGFQYYDVNNTGNGQLRFFEIRGMGRTLLSHLHDALQQSDGIMGPHVVLTSGTSWAPGSWQYHLVPPPDAVLLPNRRDVTAETVCYFKPLPDPENPAHFLSVSGVQQTEARIRNLRVMARELARKQLAGPSLFDAELNKLPEERRRILLVVGSYEEAAAVGEALAAERGDLQREEVLTLMRDSEDEDTWKAPQGKLPRSLLNQLYQRRQARFLVAPLRAIERGHNILVGQEAAIGSVFFLVRPYPVPGDLGLAVQKMNAWATGYVPTLTDLTATEAGKRLREIARREWDNALQERETYKEATDRKPLLWTQFVLVWQCIGRLLRGGVAARVFFIDAKWAENSARGERDTEATSMLVGFQNILREALADPDPARRAIATTLYGPAAAALEHIEGVRRD